MNHILTDKSCCTGYMKSCDEIQKQTIFGSLSKWFSCNGELIGVGPTMVFAGAATMFLYKELQGTPIVGAGDRPSLTFLQNYLVISMTIGILIIMIQLWVCATRFLQFYLNSVIVNSPNFLIELTTSTLFGQQVPVPALEPLATFLKAQQPLIHITLCWILSIYTAEYIRKKYCREYEMPIVERWQTQMQHRIISSVTKLTDSMQNIYTNIADKINTFILTLQPGSQQRIR